MTRENHTLFLILFKLWKYTGLPVYELQHENFVNVKSRNIYAAVLFLVASFYISLKQIYKENKRVIFDDITCTELIVLGLQNVTILIVSYNKRHDILRILLEIQLSEKLVAEISNKSQTSSNRKKLILGIAILKYGMLFTMLIIDLLNLPKQRINTLVHTMNLGFHYHFELVIFVYLISLVNQYRELNEHVKLNGKTERLQIIEVIKAHATLNYNFALTKKCFEGLILLKSVCDAFITTVGVYYFIQTLLQPGHLVLGSSAVLFFCLTLLVNFLGAVFFQNIFEQEKILTRNINFTFYYIDEKMFVPYKKERLFAAKTTMTELDLTICGLFPLNFDYISGMLTGVSSYVMYLMQFHRK